MSLHFGWKNTAGMVCVCVGRMNLHLAVQRSRWIFGHESTWHDGEWHSFGLGPILMVCW